MVFGYNGIGIFARLIETVVTLLLIGVVISIYVNL